MSLAGPRDEAAVSCSNVLLIAVIVVALLAAIVTGSLLPLFFCPSSCSRTQQQDPPPPVPRSSGQPSSAIVPPTTPPRPKLLQFHIFNSYKKESWDLLDVLMSGLKSVTVAKRATSLPKLSAPKRNKSDAILRSLGNCFDAGVRVMKKAIDEFGVSQLVHGEMVAAKFWLPFPKHIHLKIVATAHRFTLLKYPDSVGDRLVHLFASLLWREFEEQMTQHLPESSAEDSGSFHSGKDSMVESRRKNSSGSEDEDRPTDISASLTLEFRCVRPASSAHRDSPRDSRFADSALISQAESGADLDHRMTIASVGTTVLDATKPLQRTRHKDRQLFLQSSNYLQRAEKRHDVQVYTSSIDSDGDEPSPSVDDDALQSSMDDEEEDAWKEVKICRLLWI